MLGTNELIHNAWREGLCIPAFNVPYLPMVSPVVRAAIDTDAFVFISTARLEWYKFEARGPEFVREAYEAVADTDHTRLHLDHVPVIDEDGLRVDFLPDIQKALDLRYDSVMVDGSRLPLAENITTTRQAVLAAHEKGVPCEAELGAILGHEQGPLPPYEELFTSGKGFTRVDEAVQFVAEAQCDWLSIAAGNIHGAISAATKDQKKVTARLNIERIRQIRDAVQIPLVLHGGSGIQRDCVLEAISCGIAKVNVAAEIRQAYEGELRRSNNPQTAQTACYDRTVWLLTEYFGLKGTARRIRGEV